MPPKHAKSDAAAGSKKGPDDAVLVESINKQMRNFKLYEHYSLSPNIHKTLVLSNKPTNAHTNDVKNSHEDEEYKMLLQNTLLTPPQKFSLAVTTSQEYGWDPVPLFKTTDRRFHHPKLATEITRAYGAFKKA